VQCTVAADCPAPQVCHRNHTCVQCLYNEDCTDPSLAVCQSFTCIPGCVTDEQCPGNLVCNRQNVCVECTTDSDCQSNSAGAYCLSDACVACTANYHCWDSNNAKPICANATHTCQPCKKHEDCFGFTLYQACDTGTGVCVPDSYNKGFGISAIILGSLGVAGVIIAVILLVALQLRPSP